MKRRRHVPRLTRLLLAAVLALPLRPAAGAEPPEEAAARLPDRESASEIWSFVASFEAGHAVLLDVMITNLGLGDRNAGVVGHLIDPASGVHHFRKGKREGKWRLSEDGLRIKVGPILLDQHGPEPRLLVDKAELKIDLGFGLLRTAATWQEPDRPGLGLALLGAAEPVAGTIWRAGMAEPLAVRGRAALTHRWVPELESRLVARRIQFFSLDEELALYLSELTSPGGESRSWVVIERQGRIVHQAHDLSLALEPTGPEGEPGLGPARLRFEGPGLSGRVDLGSVLVRYDPLRDLPWPMRWAMALVIRWRSAWRASPFEITWRAAGGQAPVRIDGVGLANVTRFDRDADLGEGHESGGGVHANRRPE